MMRFTRILLISILVISCNAQQKPIENSAEKVQTTIIDSVNAQHDNIATKDSLNTSNQKVTKISQTTEVYINIYCHGYGPLEVEEKITSPIENALETLEDVDEINSKSEDEYSKIIVFLDPNISKQEGVLIVQEKVNQLIKNGKLPEINGQKLQPKITSYTTFDEKYRYNYTTNEIENKSERIIDTVFFIQNAKFTTSKDIAILDSWNTLLQKHVSADGVVDYKGFKKDRSKLLAYIKILGENMPTDIWTKEEKLAYWMNAYNALTVDLILRNYPLKSIKDIKKPWNQRLWKLDEKWYNLDEIEHKILRKMNEPRIHFAINCASFSCPPLLNEAFTAEKLEQQLTQVTKTFLADSRRNTITKNTIEISKIFKWFSKDFKQNGSLIDFLNKYSDVKISEKAKKKYKDYNWDLNE